MRSCAPPRQSIRKSALARCIGEATRGEAKFLRAALWENDPLAAAILEETAEDLAFGLSHVAHLFHPQIIVLGGGLALVGEPLRAAVERALRGFVMEGFCARPENRAGQVEGGCCSGRGAGTGDWKHLNSCWNQIRCSVPG